MGESSVRTTIVNNISIVLTDGVTIDTKSPVDDFVVASFNKNKSTFLTMYFGNAAGFPSKDCYGKIVEQHTEVFVKKTIDCENKTRQILLENSLDWPRNIHATLLYTNKETIEATVKLLDSIKLYSIQ